MSRTIEAARPKTDLDGQPKSASRRLVLKALGFGALGVLLDSGRPVYQFQQPQSDEIRGPILKPEKPLDITTLADTFVQNHLSNRPVNPNPTIIRSTLYHGLRFFGADHQKAALHTRIISDSGEQCPGALCVYDLKMGLATQVNAELINRAPNWIAFAQALCHESYHLDVKVADNAYTEENFGILGRVKIEGKRRGFSSTNFMQSPADKLVAKEVTLIVEGQKSRINQLEELSAEYGRIRFFRELISKSGWAVPESEQSRTGYPDLLQAAVDMDNTERINGTQSWREFFYDSIDPQTIDRYHRSNNRYGFLLQLGEAVRRRNGQYTYISKQDTAALGLVAFADFADIAISNRNLIGRLIQYRITPELIAHTANIIIAKNGF